MLIKKKPYEFWNFRDTRKEKFGKIKVPELPQIDQKQPKKAIKGYISHHILLPIKHLPIPLINRFRADLTLRNPVFDKARKYGKGFVNYGIPEFLRFYCMDTEWLGLPRSVKMSYVHKKFEQCGLKLKLEDIRPEFEKMPFPEKKLIKPRFYQNEAIDQIIKGNTIIKLKCGRGKTILCLLAIAKIRLRTLILVRTNILLGQWVDSIKQIFELEDNDIGIFNSKKKCGGLITVATQQTISNMSREEKRKIGETYGHIVLDECHEIAAPVYRELMTYFKARYVTGLSATPFREDKLDPVLKLYIGQIKEIDDLGDFNTTVKLRHTEFEYMFIGKKNKYHKLIETLIHDKKRNQLIVEDLKKYVQEGRTVICYSSRIRHMEILEKMLKKALPGVSTDILASNRYGITLKIKDQESIKNRLRNKEIQVLNGGKIVEQGFDAPPLSVAVLATPTKSKRLILQVLGRCQREYPGKSEAILHDYIDEQCSILLYQFFNKNKRIYKDYQKIFL